MVVLLPLHHHQTMLKHISQPLILLILHLAVTACQDQSPAYTNQREETPPLNSAASIELIFPDSAAPESIKHSIIWLHGLGATANDFPPIVPHLNLNKSRPIRFIFPQAPDRPITINGGMRMPGWYDIKGLDLAAKEDRDGVEQSRATVEALIQQQIDQGVPAENIILAGFSQGGAVTYYTGVRSQHRLAGLLTLSTYLVFLDQTEAEHSGVNKVAPIFASHGTHDPVVPVDLGQQSVEALKELGYSLQWQTYPMQHEVTLPQIQAIGQWINRVFSD